MRHEKWMFEVAVEFHLHVVVGNDPQLTGSELAPLPPSRHSKNFSQMAVGMVGGFLAHVVYT